MAPNRITRGGAVRRALLLALACVALAAGPRGLRRRRERTTTAVPDKAADAEILNNVLARELAAVGAYDPRCRCSRRRPRHAPANSAPRNRNTSTRSSKRCAASAAKAEPRRGRDRKRGPEDAGRRARLPLRSRKRLRRRRPARDLPPHRALAALAARLDRRQPGPAPGRAAAGARRRRRRIDPRGVRGRHVPPGSPSGEDDRRMTGPLYAIGRFCSRHHWPVIGALGRARRRPRPDRPGRRQQDQRKPDPARHRLDHRDRTARRQPARTGLRQQPAGDGSARAAAS